MKIANYQPDNWDAFIADAEQYPPLATADLDNGPDDELFNAGLGSLITRLEARMNRDDHKRNVENFKKQPPVDYEEARKTIPGLLFGCSIFPEEVRKHLAGED